MGKVIGVPFLLGSAPRTQARAEIRHRAKKNFGSFLTGLVRLRGIPSGNGREKSLLIKWGWRNSGRLDRVGGQASGKNPPILQRLGNNSVTVFDETFRRGRSYFGMTP
ncbi:MAG: hypothetical protein ABI832_01915 [bacterium]